MVNVARLFLGYLLLASGSASGIDFSLRHHYGDFVDRGDFTADLWTDNASRMDCTRGVTQSREGNRIVLVAQRAAVPEQGCFGQAHVIGPLPVGSYEVEVRLAATGGGAVESRTRPLDVAQIAGRCNAEPVLQPALFLVHRTADGAQLKQRIETDPAFAARIGNPTPYRVIGIASYGLYVSYPPLVDPTWLAYQIEQTGEFLRIERNGWVCGLPPPDAVAPFFEFHHAGLDQYFYSAHAGEIAAIDAGKVGPWTRTGESFRAVVARGCQNTDTPVYRFAGRPGSGTGSHVFTRDRSECGTVDRSGQWDFEGVPMYASPLNPDGTCAAPYASSRIPLYRVWRPFGESTHRFTTSRAVVAAMQAKGWVDEGAAMCVVP